MGPDTAGPLVRSIVFLVLSLIASVCCRPLSVIPVSSFLVHAFCPFGGKNLRESFLCELWHCLVFFKTNGSIGHALEEAESSFRALAWQ